MPWERPEWLWRSIAIPYGGLIARLENGPGDGPGRWVLHEGQCRLGRIQYVRELEMALGKVESDKQNSGYRNRKGGDLVAV